MTDAYTKNGQAGFLQLMNVTKQDNQQLPAVRTMAAHMLSLQSTTGMTGVLTEINGRLSAAAKHEKTMKPQGSSGSRKSGAKQKIAINENWWPRRESNTRPSV
jgi:hypothetical protein